MGDNTVAMETNMLPPGGGTGEPKEPETACGRVNSAQSDPGLVTEAGGMGGGGLARSPLLSAHGLGPWGTPGFQHQS